MSFKAGGDEVRKHPEERVFSIVVSSLSAVGDGGLLLARFRVSRLSKLLCVVGGGSVSISFKGVCLPSIFSGGRVDEALILLLLTSLLGRSKLPDHRIDLFTLISTLLRGGRGIRLLDEKGLFRGGCRTL